MNGATRCDPLKVDIGKEALTKEMIKQIAHNTHNKYKIYEDGTKIETHDEYLDGFGLIIYVKMQMHYCDMRLSALRIKWL
jgi:hypothetical protein